MWDFSSRLGGPARPSARTLHHQVKVRGGREDKQADPLLL